MKTMPRILPLVGIAVGGVLAINALAGARDLPGLFSAARANAEEAAAKVKPAKAAKPAKVADKPAETALATPLPGVTPAATGSATDVAAVGLPPPTLQPRAVCAPKMAPPSPSASTPGIGRSACSCAKRPKPSAPRAVSPSPSPSVTRAMAGRKARQECLTACLTATMQPSL